MEKTLWTAFLLGLLGACSQAPEPGEPLVPDVPSAPDPGILVAGVRPPAALDDLSAQAETARQTTPDELRESHATLYATELGYDPLTATGLNTIFEELFWDDGRQRAEEQLALTGFALSAEKMYPSFASGYAEIYMHDLPVYITADMILEALHRSYSKILQAVEKDKLRPSLKRLLASTRDRLVERQDTLSPETASDLNFYLGVAISLLNQKVASTEPEGVSQFVQAAQAAQGIHERVLFGVPRNIDFSQFTPRGHYTGSEELKSYFQAMMWLGRIDFRLIETQEDGSQILRRRQVEASLALRDLVASSAPDDYAAIDDTISAFVGEHDYFTLTDLSAFLDSLDNPASLDTVSDSALAQALVDGQLTQQRIASHVMERAPGSDTYPLNVSFALLGQRYTVDSHVLSNVVYDRLPTRVVPDALDVAFGALKNDQAVHLLGSELDEEAGFSGALASIRLLIDEHPSEYFQGSLYTSWLEALRSLSAPSGGPTSDLPAVARTDAWGRRVLNTQLASWAELRHNNVLYVKQSYTSSAACEYPDAYVDPYPEFFNNVVRHAELGQTLIASLKLDEPLDTKIQNYFGAVAHTATVLREMAAHQLTGAPHSDEHLAFINQAVTTDINCDGTILGHSGWYADMHFDALGAVKQDPIITDVHTDIGGDLPVSRPASVLHVGTHLPRLLLVTVDTCSGPRAYVGVASLFQQKLEEGLVRLTDQEWNDDIYGKRHTPAWLEPALTR